MQEIPLNAIALRGMVQRIWGQKGVGGGDSAQRYRVARNGAPFWGQKGEKKGGGETVSLIEKLTAAALLFSPPPPGRAHHSAANAVSERNLLRLRALKLLTRINHP